MDINAYVQKAVDWFLTSGLHITLVLILALIALKATKVLSTRLISVVVRQKEDPEFQKRTQTLGSIVRYVLIIAIIIVKLYMGQDKQGQSPPLRILTEEK